MIYKPGRGREREEDVGGRHWYRFKTSLLVSPQKRDFALNWMTTSINRIPEIWLRNSHRKPIRLLLFVLRRENQLVDCRRPLSVQSFNCPHARCHFCRLWTTEGELNVTFCGKLSALGGRIEKKNIQNRLSIFLPRKEDDSKVYRWNHTSLQQYLVN